MTLVDFLNKPEAEFKFLIMEIEKASMIAELMYEEWFESLTGDINDDNEVELIAASKAIKTKLANDVGNLYSNNNNTNYFVTVLNQLDTGCLFDWVNNTRDMLEEDTSLLIETLMFNYCVYADISVTVTADPEQYDEQKMLAVWKIQVGDDLTDTIPVTYKEIMENLYNLLSETTNKSYTILTTV